MCYGLVDKKRQYTPTPLAFFSVLLLLSSIFLQQEIPQINLECYQNYTFKFLLEIIRV